MNIRLIGRSSVTFAACFLLVVSAFADVVNLPDRESPVPLTTDSVPHVQIGVDAVPEISTQLLRQVEKLQGVELRDTVIGRAGSTGFWLSEHMALARPDAIIRGREFAHVHPDGSLHASLSPDVAAMAVRAGWAVYHPWANKKPGWQGFVMIYTPASVDELDAVLRLVTQSYRFVSGLD